MAEGTENRCMVAKNAIPIVDSIIEIFALMGDGSALGLQVKEISRRIHLVRHEVEWTADLALAASKMRAMAAMYATKYIADNGCNVSRARNEAHLDKLRAAFIEFRAHVERQESINEQRCNMAK
jgi:hypothetical protein